MRVLGVGATARASAYLYNREEEIEALVQALGTVRTLMGGPGA
jgi:selenocysteine lyase/cysteine desulfurase